MAVFDPSQPNLAPFYNNIQQTLQQRGDIAEKNQGVLGNVAAIAAPIAQEAQTKEAEANKKDLLSFKTALDEQLDDHQTANKTASEGKMPYTQADIDSFWDQNKLPPESKPTVKGTIYLSDDDIQKQVALAQQRTQLNNLADQLDKTDPKRAAAVRALGVPNEKMTQGAAEAIRKIAFPEDDNTAAKIQYKTLSDGNTYPVLNGAVVGAALKLPDTSGVISDYPSLQKVSPKSAKDLDAITSAFNKDPETRKATAKLNALNSLEKALSGKTVNPNEVTNIRAELAQAVGNVPGGRFSSTLLQNEGYSKAVADRMEQFLETSSTGGLSDTNRKNDLAQVQENKAVVKKQLQDSINGNADQAVAKIKNLNPEFAKKYIGATTGHLLDQSPEEYLISINAPVTPKNLEWAKGKVNGSK